MSTRASTASHDNRRDKLVDIQKREQLKGMLITKFKNKYSNQAPKYIENEVNNYLKNDRLTEESLRGLDLKIMKKIANDKKKDEIQDDRKSNASRGSRPGSVKSLTKENLSRHS